MERFRKRRSFKQEFKRQLRFAIDAAIGFTIAYAWRESIFEGFRNFTARLLDIAPDHYLTDTYTALFVTFIGVVAIFITSRLLRD